MSAAASGMVLFVALEHAWFLVLEMFLWQKPIGRKVFRLTEERALATASLAANQGLYNGFLCAGLVWGLLTTSAEHAFSIKVFFLGCIVLAGIFGALTASRSILVVQAAPAALALVLVWLSRT